MALRSSGIVCALALVLASRVAAADDVVASTTASAPAPDDKPTTLGEVGLFFGGFISSADHQFYELAKFPGTTPSTTRPELRTVSPEFGLRYAFALRPRWAIEAELGMISASTKGMDLAGGPDGSAKLYNGHVQLMFQYPLRNGLVPFAAVGAGLMHTSSSVLGSDTDWPLHVGAGARFWISDSIAVRVDGRYLRGPSQQAPYTLNEGYGEFGIGISYMPRIKPSKPEVPHIDGDRDGDGIPDSKDKCPNEPEDRDMFQDQDGCPDLDNDGDGIPDAKDKCPLDPEDKDGYQDDDGCPDLDNDGDGIPDARDKCPNQPEDKDGFQDLDGCPDLDNDGDGIPDDKDKCPNEPETINGVLDDDGCPDKGDALVVLSPDRLEMLDSITFQRDKILKSSNNILGQVAATLRAHAEIVRVRVTVHVQPTADTDKDQALSETRAKAIREWLVKWGIAETRLEARGFGGTKPLVPADQRGSAAINERVELIILERR